MPDQEPASGTTALKARFSGDLAPRVGSALVMASAALGAAWWGGWPLVVFWTGAAILIWLEWTAMARLAHIAPLRVGVLAVIAACGAAFGADASAPVVLALAGPGAAVCLVAAGSTRDRSWALAGLACALVVALAPVAIRADPVWGLTGLLWMFAVVWGTDVAAYFTGRAFGGPKLMPSVSPKKTWSGFAGGLLVGTLAGVVVSLLAASLGWAPPVGAVTVAVLSAVASVLGQIGDLAESALKRHFDVKDSSHFIPGHGGVMDRLDAFFAVCAFTGFLLVIGRTVGP